MRVFARSLFYFAAAWALADASLSLFLLGVSVLCWLSLPYEQAQQHSVRSTSILVLVAIVGFVGIRRMRPFLEGYTGYSGPGSMANRIGWLSYEIEAFKKDHGGKPPSPAGMWDILLSKSDSTELGDTPPTGSSCGPYLHFQGETQNPLNGNSAVSDSPGRTVGWVYKVNGTDYTLSAVDAKGNAVLTPHEAHLYYFRPSERLYVMSQSLLNDWGGLVFSIPLVVYGIALFTRRSSRRATGNLQGSVHP